VSRTARFTLPLLLLVSGFCGISYEILYAKLLGNLLGNQFTINASVLLTFLAGIGLGTLYAHRLVRWLWAIEAGIGAYAALMALGYTAVESVLYTWVPAIGTSLVACAAAAIALLAVPAFLVGCSVPLFAAYLSTLRSSHVFSVTYGLYNLGAASTALTMEFVLLRAVGLRAATGVLATLNVVVALGLWALARRAPLVPAPRLDRLRFSRPVLGALVLASSASAIFQLMMIKLAECILGPFNETFSLVLVVVLAGLAVGSLAAGKLGLSFSGALLVALAGLAALQVSFGAIATVYAATYLAAVESYPLLVALKVALVAALMGLPAVGFGATVPALLRAHRDVARESGELLFVSSMANVAGFVLMAFVLHRFVDYGPLLLIVTGLTALALLLHAGLRRAAGWAGATLAVLACVFHGAAWNEQLVYYGHTEFHSAELLARARSIPFSAERFKDHQDVFAITRRDGEPYFFINGYISIPLSSASEKIVGALSAMYAPRLDRALVLGVGSGATAGTVGLLFDATEAVEINGVVLANQHRMTHYNFDIANQKTLRLIHDDGIHYVKTTPQSYSLILNTVTTPLYFSSSKLYTRDFLRAVKAKLTPDGVYTTWIDRKLGERGVDIILTTLEDSFGGCWMNYLKSSYYLLACSDAPLGLRQFEAVAANERLGRYLAEEYAVPLDLVPYSVLSVDPFALRADAAAPINTLDWPILEHEMARLDGEVRLTELKDRLIERLDLQAVGREVGREVEWEPGAFAFWADLRVEESSLLAETLADVVPRQLGDFTEGYRSAALRAGEKVGSADAYFEYGYRMYERRICSGAVTSLGRAVQLDPALYRAYYYLGRCFEIQGDDRQAAGFYRQALRVEPGYEKARAALDRVSSRTPGAEGARPAAG
jgi:predicted membrane-bound spermidine synthase